MMMGHCKTFRIEKTNVCDPFEIIKSDNDEQGVITICFHHTKRDEAAYVRVMPYMENIALEISAIRGAYFISLMADEGFRISIQPDALRDFLHILLHPEESINEWGTTDRTFENIEVPDDVKLVSSYIQANMSAHTEGHK